MDLLERKGEAVCSEIADAQFPFRESPSAPPSRTVNTNFDVKLELHILLAILP